MAIAHCKNCQKKFYVKPSWLVKGCGKYCSRLCHHLGLKNGKVVKCFICQKESYKPKRVLERSKSRKYFCSKSCQTKWRNAIFIGPKHANWKHGEQAYRTVLTRHKVPKICKLCNIKDNRILLVHHIDRNRKNNKINNLVWLCHNCHFLVHHYEQERKKMVPIV